MKEYYLRKADQNLPKLFESSIYPVCDKKVFDQGDTVILDLKKHCVGYFSFVFGYIDVYVDAPVTLRVRFCETEREIYDDFSAYQGRLCASWLQEDVINVDFPGVFKMPRRYAARFIVIEVKYSPREFTLSDFQFVSLTSADRKSLEHLKISDQKLAKIDEIAINTLESCMQRVYEDGPKRDRRLWTGDLRLEALANAYTFKNFALTRRCLYLFAATKPNALGIIPGNLYEFPDFVPGSVYIRDYSLLFVATLCDHLEHTGDKDTFLDLYPVVKSQMDAAHADTDEFGLRTVRKFGDFIDWCAELKKNTSLNGVYIYVLDILCKALRSIGHNDEEIFAKRLQDAKESSLAHLYDKERNAFINERDEYQYSVHSTVFMVLAGVIEGEDAKNALLDVLDCQESVKPFTPYMHHYVLEAMFKLGLDEMAFDYMKDFWGKMADLGADTFFEAFVPDDPDFSPYQDRMINSMCHAWSCTPTYFIRKYAKQ